MCELALVAKVDKVISEANDVLVDRKNHHILIIVEKTMNVDWKVIVQQKVCF
jgi:hypothetical protein